MTASKQDRIWWAPADLRRTTRHPAFPDLVHVCRAAVVVAPTTRGALDPMALGECRYCQQTLPVPA